MISPSAVPSITRNFRTRRPQSVTPPFFQRAAPPALARVRSLVFMEAAVGASQNALPGGRGLGGCVWGSFEGHLPAIKFLTSGAARCQGLHPTVAPAQKSGVMAPWIRCIPMARRRTGHRARRRIGLGCLGGGKD